MASGLLCYQYYKFIPYYNGFISVFVGTLVFTYFWISVNAFLMKLVHLRGHVIIIAIGIPMLWILVKNLRFKRVELLLNTDIDKMKLDIDVRAPC